MNSNLNRCAEYRLLNRSIRSLASELAKLREIIFPVNRGVNRCYSIMDDFGYYFIPNDDFDGFDLDVVCVNRGVNSLP